MVAELSSDSCRSFLSTAVLRLTLLSSLRFSASPAGHTRCQGPQYIVLAVCPGRQSAPRVSPGRATQVGLAGFAHAPAPDIGAGQCSLYSCWAEEYQPRPTTRQRCLKRQGRTGPGRKQVGLSKQRFSLQLRKLHLQLGNAGLCRRSVSVQSSASRNSVLTGQSLPVTFGQRLASRLRP